LSIRTVEGGWNPPNTAVPIRSFLNLIELVFLYSIGWIGDDSMDRTWRNSAQPFQAIGVKDRCLANFGVGVVERQFFRFGGCRAHLPNPSPPETSMGAVTKQIAT
jgi:hypothetical protein